MANKRFVWAVRIGDNWTCSYCEHAQVLDPDRLHVTDFSPPLKLWKEGRPELHILSVICANRDCRELTLLVTLIAIKGEEWHSIRSWPLLPPSCAKPQPDYIPQPIRDDYCEACNIRDLSPKASATLSRRCLQGMVRDFCGISKGRLVDEIKELRKRVDSGQAPLGVQADTMDAIDSVRTIGNIGAHMEKEINVIVDVDPTEAQMLIGLVELLLSE